MKTKKTTQTPGADLLSMDEAIARLKTTRPTFYRWLKTGKLKGMKVGRQWRFYAKDIEGFLKGESLRWDLPTDIGPLVNALRAHAGVKAPNLSALSDAERVALAVDLVLKGAIKLGATDIHLDSVRDKGRIRYRLAGTLSVAAEFDGRLLPALIAQFKTVTTVCPLDILNHPMDAKIMYDEAGGNYDLRFAFLPAIGGMVMNIRILPRDIAVEGLDWLGVNPVSRKRLDRVLSAKPGRQAGMVVFSGPVASGKTTALYAAVKEVATPERKVISIEDPVEGILHGVVQTPVTGALPFPALLKAALRADANVIAIGELVNAETITLGLKAAMTGHIVIAGMNAASSARALKRMVEIGVAPYDIAEGIRLVTSQRLVRRVCRDCAVKDTPTAEELGWAAAAAAACGLDWEAQPRKFMKGAGCPKCGGTGFRGRIAAFEALEVTPAIAKLVREAASEEQIEALAVKQGMVTMAADAIARACAGETTLSQAMAETGDS